MSAEQDTGRKKQVKEAIADYIKSGQPLAPEDYLFFMKNNPRRIILEIGKAGLLEAINLSDREVYSRYVQISQAPNKAAGNQESYAMPIYGASDELGLDDIEKW
jgi:hypothetical protein